MKQYKLTVSENQLRVIMIATESYFRVRMGQFFDLTDDLAFCGFDYNKPTDATLAACWESDFNDRINRRNDCQDVMNRAFRIAQPIWNNGGYMRFPNTPDMISAIDIWHMIRHYRWKDNPNRVNWTVDAYPPFPESGEELIKIEAVEE